jgi:hypothetical protein
MTPITTPEYSSNGSEYRRLQQREGEQNLDLLAVDDDGFKIRHLAFPLSRAGVSIY